MIEILSTNLPVLAGLVFVLGLLTGSFLNVVIHRFPLMLNREWKATATEILTESNCTVSCPKEELPSKYNLMTPASACPKCHHKITALENIPVFSWLILKGKCSNCQTKISARYPFVELLTGLTFMLCAINFGWTLSLMFALIFTCFLIAGSFIDYDHKILPDQLTLPLIWIGLVAALLLAPADTLPGFAKDLPSSVIGALAGYLSLWSIYWLFKLLTGKEGMGHGDFKLLSAIGAFLGWQMLPLVILLSTVTGAVLGIASMVISKKGRDHKIPFGPFLAIAGWIALIWGETITNSYIQMLQP